MTQDNEELSAWKKEAFYAASAGDVARLAEAITHIDNLDYAYFISDESLAPNIQGRVKYFSPLAIAGVNGHLQCVTAILEAGADPNYSFSHTSENALLHCCLAQQTEVVEKLLAAGADPKSGHTVIDGKAVKTAKATLNLDIIRLLQRSIILNAPQAETPPSTQNAEPDVEQTRETSLSLVLDQLLNSYAPNTTPAYFTLAEAADFQDIHTFLTSLEATDSLSVSNALHEMERSGHPLTLRHLLRETAITGKPLIADLTKSGIFPEILEHLNQQGVYLHDELLKDGAPGPILQYLCEQDQAKALFTTGNCPDFREPNIKELFVNLPAATQDDLYEELLNPEYNIPVMRSYEGDAFNFSLPLRPVTLYKKDDPLANDRAIFDQYDLAKMDLSQFDAKAPTFIATYMPAATLAGAEIPNATFAEVIWYSGNAANANMSNSRFPNAHIMGTAFVQCDLSQCDFRCSDARHANFDYADLRNANFEGADLAGASFDGAIIIGANFNNAQNINTQGAVATLDDLMKALTQEQRRFKLEGKTSRYLEMLHDTAVDIYMDRQDSYADIGATKVTRTELGQLIRDFAKSYPTEGGHLARQIQSSHTHSPHNLGSISI